MIIDAHCHVWPDHIAPRVLADRKSGGMDPRYDGTLDGLRRTMDEAGIDKAMCLATAAVPKHVAGTNRFIGSIDRSRFIPFGTVHPGLSVEENLKHLQDNGIPGVKLHPLFQDLSLGDPKVHDILRGLAEAGIVVLTHAGAGGDEAANERGAPRHIVSIVDSIPNLTLIACYFGGYHLLDEAEQRVVGSRVILETSWPPSMADLDRDRIRALIERHGADRVVFGSDWPMTDPAVEIAGIRALGLAPKDEDAVLGGNLATLLGITS